MDVVLARLAEAHPGVEERLRADAGLRAAVEAVTAASRALTTRLTTDPLAIEVLADLDTRPPVGDDLVAWKGRELLRIAARDLLGIDRLEQTGRALADLAADVLACAWEQAGDRAAGVAVIGMGKLGAGELNYASDIDVMFVGDGDPRPILDVARRCFRVDANLRPEGRDGPLTRTLASYEAYWERWAQAWEFQALLKARAVAGDAEVGAAFCQAASERLWGRVFTGDDLRSLRVMKARAEQLVARRGLKEREVKLGPGGIRDVEFSVQLLQLVHGRHDPPLRTPATLDALRVLGEAGYIDAEDGADLDESYRFLRDVEHRLQLVDEQQVHAVPADPVGRERLARTLGFDDGRAFDAELRSRQALVRSIHQRLYFRPLLEAFTRSDAPLSPAAVEARLAAFGFAEVERTKQAVQELTRGLTRSSRLMQQMLPLLLQWLADSPDPDVGLLGLRTLVDSPHQASRLAAAFRESPEAARRLCLLLGTSRLLQRALEQHPDAVRSLDADTLGNPRRLVESGVSWRPPGDEQRGAMGRLVEEQRLRIAARDVFGVVDVETVGRDLTALAEALLDWAVGSVDAEGLAVIGMGRFGGAELSYASDLDVLLVGDADAGERLLRVVKGDTPARRLWLLDADLRPEGKQGVLARSLESYAKYYERWAATWERQALVRARFVAGDPEVGRRFLELVERFVWRPLSEEDTREIRRMKARIERERIPAGDDPQFHLKLGRGSLSDVEWTAQLLQLRHGVRATSTVEALAALVARGALSSEDGEVLLESYRFCERTRNRWFLVKGSPGDSLPTAADQLARLARSLGTTAADLRQDYRRVTRRARAVFEREFFGATGSDRGAR